MQQVHDRHEVREVAPLDRPVVRLAVGHERPPPGRVEVPALRLRRHQRPERSAVGPCWPRTSAPAAGEPTARPADRGSTAVGVADAASSAAASAVRAARIAGLAGHLLHQTLHASRLHKRRRRFRLRILGVRATFVSVTRQAILSSLFSASWTPGPVGGRACPQPPAVHLDGDHLRRRRHARRQFPPPPFLGLARRVPATSSRADLLRQLLDVAGRDRQAAQAQGEGGVGEGMQARAGGDDLLEQSRGCSRGRQDAADGPLGGKSPGGSRDSGRPVRSVAGVCPAPGGCGPPAAGAQGRPQSGQGCCSPRPSACCSRRVCRVPAVSPAAAARAICSMVAKSTSRPGPSSPKARRATILPHWAARQRSSWMSSGVKERRAMKRPALELRQQRVRDCLLQVTTEDLTWQSCS